MGKKIERDPQSVVPAHAILEKYKHKQVKMYKMQ